MQDLKTVECESFVRHWSSDLIVLAADSDIEVMVENKHWHMDGTFAIAPAEFEQVYTIHALCGELLVPCIYALMKRRTESAYVALFEILKVLKGTLEPLTVMLDFEMQVVRALPWYFRLSVLSVVVFTFVKMCLDACSLIVLQCLTEKKQSFHCK